MKFVVILALMIWGLSVVTTQAVIHRYFHTSRQHYANRNAAPVASAQPVTAVPAGEQPQSFKDLPVNSVFYFWSDRENKSFPKIKTSTTTAAPATAATAVVPSTIPADSLVLGKKDAAGGNPTAKKK